MASVGVHVLGGNPNSASVISGPNGNPFDALAAALKEKPKRPAETGEEATVAGEEASWLSWVTVPTNESVSGVDDDPSNETGTGSPDETPGSQNFLKKY